MQGQYTLEEIITMPGRTHLTSDGAGDIYKARRKSGHTVNYYHKCYDGSWLNYDCKTKY